MDEQQIMRVFFEIHSNLPREGPGNFDSIKRAFSILPKLNRNPYILDIGCGPGMQTLDLISLTDGKIVAVDNHQQFLDALQKRAVKKSVAERIELVNADMSSLDFKHGTFDLIWSEGSAYFMGFENAIRTWKPLLKKHGYLAVTEVSWTKPGPPDELKSFWDEEYPQIQDIEANRTVIENAGYTLIGHFILPESAWWDHYYTPIENKLPTLREKYKHNPDAIAIIESHDREIDFYRKYSEYYGYVFYIMQTKDQ
ncbi:MAG: class I SAM-dependent methyltransferase [Thermodesulfobacteriota bacterium]|nr:class I SAM-dependent methyltransferase [Thermodesulfobacteriota bacterium]